MFPYLPRGHISCLLRGEKIKLSYCVSAVQAIIVQETTVSSSYCRGLFLHFTKIFAFWQGLSPLRKQHVGWKAEQMGQG